ncbi:double-strand break repair protein MRE11 [Neocloeon triangulifer]|uniref:double-strand break repair protein MRE11 n=1 Tax=Neocloeon triangulifer TaxID=2078957 RepID=UPI00286F0905|nr:double-strand break repair protein MRE11 [Neocloeon triangulifer]
MASDNMQGDESTMKILFATDIHLGYNETHPTRGEDSFIAFEEILRIGKKYKVDFILLGGDLFHDGRPSVNCYSKCMDLLNRYCMGDGEVKISVLSDPAEIFSFSSNPMVNFMNPNLNVALPIFSIHGNHDDPLGYNSKCSLDMLSAAGLINYFGKYLNLQDDISLVPLLVAKGNTKVAIYGLGALKDKVANRMFREEKVHIMQPEDPETWYNVMVVHQNRACHNKDECLHENLLPESMDLIFWGHEHECKLEPEYNNNRNFYVTQPGSSVATSLSEGEAVQKKVGILYVNNKKFQMRPIPLKTVRPFVFDVINLATDYRDRPARNMKQGVQAFLEQRVEDLLKEAENQLTGHPKQPKLPLIRMKVLNFNQDELFNIVRFGLQFEEKVANPTDMVMITRVQGARQARDVLDQDAFDAAKSEAILHNVEELIEKYFTDCEPGKRVQLLPVAMMNEALEHQMKGDSSAFEIVIRKRKDFVVQKILEKGLTDDDDIKDEFAAMGFADGDEENGQMINEIRAVLEGPRQGLLDEVENLEEEDDDFQMRSDGEDQSNEANEPITSKGKGRGRATTRALGRARGAAKRTPASLIDDDSDGTLNDPPARPTRGPGSRGGRGSRGKRGAKAAQPARHAPPPPVVNISRPTRQTQPGNRMAMMFEDDSD